MQNYNTYTNDNISRQGLMNSFNQSQQIKPNELINDNPSINRDGFERENKLMKSLNDDILQLNTQLRSLLMKQNDYDKISNENKQYSEKISSLQNELNTGKNQTSMLKAEIHKLKELVYEKYNNKKYLLIRDLCKKYKTDFDVVHIICDRLNVNETNINKGTLNDIVSEINKYNEKTRKVELTN
jgi:predicted RNase H-like nuclease (RuvC/YqgF family)